MRKIFVVFPVHNRVRSTLGFLESMARQTYTNFQVVICDDGSTDGTSEVLAREYPHVLVIPGTGNLWWTGGINRCVSHVLQVAADDDYVLTINNDVTVPEWYLAQKVARAQEYPGSIIGSLCVYMDKPDQIETSGFVMDLSTGTGRSLTKSGDQRSPQYRGMEQVTYVPGKGVLIPVRVYKEIGIYDEARLPHYHADADFCIRASKAGVPVFIDFDSVVFSDVNIKNMSLPDRDVTLRGMLNTFRGPYSLNNFAVLNHFAVKHFPSRRRRFLLAYYARVVGGMALRYMRLRFNQWLRR